MSRICFCLEIRIFSLCTIIKKPGSKNIKLFSCLTQLSMKFQLLRASMMIFTCLKHLDVVFILLLKVKMPTIVGILPFMSKINFMLS